MALGGDFLLNTLSIILINIVLSGDNSVVIALAVQSLPEEKRRFGIFAGAGAATLLRIIFTMMASQLLGIPYLKLIGGLLIFWIAIKLLAENADGDPSHIQARSPFHAIWIIVVADLTMSLDNVLAVAGAAKGNILLLWVGLGMSIPMVVFTSTLLSKLMGRFPMIVTLGAMMLGKVSAEMIAEEPAMTKMMVGFPQHHWGIGIVGAGLILLISAWLKRKKPKVA